MSTQSTSTDYTLAQTDLLAHLRHTHPGLGRKADYENSLTSAARLLCLSCMGGSSMDVKKCESFACPLWPFRKHATTTTRPANIVPTLDEYHTMSESRGNPDALADHRAAQENE